MTFAIVIFEFASFSTLVNLGTYSRFRVCEFFDFCEFSSELPIFSRFRVYEFFDFYEFNFELPLLDFEFTGLSTLVFWKFIADFEFTSFSTLKCKKSKSFLTWNQFGRNELFNLTYVSYASFKQKNVLKNVKNHAYFEKTRKN